MLKQTLMFALCSMMAASAMASTVVFRGTLIREKCTDDGNPFSQGDCRKVSTGSNRECLIAVNYEGARKVTALQVKAAAFVNSGDRRNDTLTARLDSPYLASSEGYGYQAKVDRETSLEAMFDLRTMALKKAAIYSNHQIERSGGRVVKRSYVQYTCAGMKAVR